MRDRVLRSVLTATALFGCGSEVATLSTCQPADGLTPICGFQNPEDLVAVPGGAWLVVSQMAVGEGAPGSLIGLRIADGQHRPLFPAPSELGDPGPGARAPAWGAPECPGPPSEAAFAPHGIDLRVRAQAAPVLAVVNHGGRQAIEFFELQRVRAEPSLVWRGCAPLPSGTWANDVAFATDQVVVTTHMMDRSGGLRELLSGIRMLFAQPTGFVLEYRLGGDWREIPDSAGSGPNGIAVSADGRDIFFSEWGASRLVRVQRHGPPQRASVDLPHHPDNLNWSRDGRLLVTGQRARLGDLVGCGDVREGTCAVPFSVVAVEPLTLETELLLDHPATATGAGSAALEVDGRLYIGTFAGDRLAHTGLPD